MELTAQAPAVSIQRPTRGGFHGRGDPKNTAFAELSTMIRERGLMRRRYTYYWIRLIASPISIAACIALFIWLGDSWWQMFVAALFAVIFTQMGFLGHDAAHRQIFKSGKWNTWVSLIISGLFVGMSLNWWNGKHARHHANPNKDGVDPDLAIPVIRPPANADLRHRSKLTSWILDHQGSAFFPFLLLEGIMLYWGSVKRVFSREPNKFRWVEISFMAVRLGGFATLAFTVLSPGKAGTFLGIQLALFGLYLGATFALNHMGMPIVPKDVKLDFFTRQVAMSRNIDGGKTLDWAMGGLNFQIEHHLFPSMARPHLRIAAPIIERFCVERGVPYTRRNVGQAFASVVEFIDNEGLGKRDPFVCPMLQDRMAVSG